MNWGRWDENEIENKPVRRLLDQPMKKDYGGLNLSASVGDEEK